jgi:hypothetical protein
MDTLPPSTSRKRSNSQTAPASNDTPPIKKTRAKTTADVLPSHEDDALWNTFDGCDDVFMRRQLVEFVNQKRTQLTEGDKGRVSLLLLLGDLDANCNRPNTLQRLVQLSRKQQDKKFESLDTSERCILRVTLDKDRPVSALPHLMTVKLMRMVMAIDKILWVVLDVRRSDNSVMKDCMTFVRRMMQDKVVSSSEQDRSAFPLASYTHVQVVLVLPAKTPVTQPWSGMERVQHQHTALIDILGSILNTYEEDITTWLCLPIIHSQDRLKVLQQLVHAVFPRKIDTVLVDLLLRV